MDQRALPSMRSLAVMVELHLCAQINNRVPSTLLMQLDSLLDLLWAAAAALN
jgi:hypothetical protein